VGRGGAAGGGWSPGEERCLCAAQVCGPQVCNSGVWLVQLRCARCATQVCGSSVRRVRFRCATKVCN
jgi:hypothetical protein